MANLDTPNGFNPVRHLNGGTVRYDDSFTITSALASDIFLGDCVKLTGTGRDIDVAAATEEMLGVFAGCRYVAANGDVVWAKQWVTGTATSGAQDAVAFVYTDPNIVYRAQCTTIAEADVGLAADLLAGAGNAATGISGFEVNGAVYGATGQFMVIGLAKEPDGINPSEYGADAKVEVVINEGHRNTGVYSTT
jgi:hypothetical protein